VKLSYNNADLVGVFNNAGQVWNHNVFWESLSPTVVAFPACWKKAG
jgi:Fe-Mn family superoxide dismutase